MLNNNKIIPVRMQIADQIRSDIIAGSLKPGTKLNEQSLAERFGVSRGPIRDVLLQLTQEGLVVSKSNVGSFVNEKLDPEVQSLMVEIRRRIEEHSIKMLKKRMDEIDFEYLESVITRITESFKNKDFTQVTKDDMEFHYYIVNLAGGEDLSNIWQSVVMRMRMNYERVDSAEDCEEEHRAILECLKNKDAKGAIQALKANIK